MKFTARLFFGLATFAIVAGGIYLFFTTEWVGIIGLGALAIAALYTAIVITIDGRHEAVEDDSPDHGVGHLEPADDAHTPHLPPPSLWPFVCSFGAATVVMGFIYHWGVAVAGGVILLVGGAGWAGVFTAIDFEMEIVGEAWRQKEYADAPEPWREDDLRPFTSLPVRPVPGVRTLPRGSVFAFVVLAWAALMVALLVL